MKSRKHYIFAASSQYDPEVFVVEYKYDDLGRLVHRAVRDRPLVMTGTPMEDSSSRFEVDYQYDGRGRLVRERILRYDLSSDRMVVTQDVQTTYDLGDNPTEIISHDYVGWAYTETRTYARGYQLTGCNFSQAGSVNVNTSGSYTYDTNNNLTTTKSVSIDRSGDVLHERMARTFTYDRKNRLKSFTHSSDFTMHLWWDGLGRVWQRWLYDEAEEAWLDSLTRYVYDGQTLAQEHHFTAAEVESAWVYTYQEVLYDYLYGPMGVRQRAQQGGGTFVDSYLLADRGTVTASIDRSTSSTVKRVELMASGDRQSYGSTQEGPISNFGYLGGFVEGYSNYSFDPLIKFGSRHYLAGLGRFLTRMGNNAYTSGGPTPIADPGVSPATPGDAKDQDKITYPPYVPKLCGNLLNPDEYKDKYIECHDLDTMAQAYGVRDWYCFCCDITWGFVKPYQPPTPGEDYDRCLNPVTQFSGGKVDRETCCWAWNNNPDIHVWKQEPGQPGLQPNTNWEAIFNDAIKYMCCSLKQCLCQILQALEQSVMPWPWSLLETYAGGRENLESVISCYLSICRGETCVEVFWYDREQKEGRRATTKLCQWPNIGKGQCLQISIWRPSGSEMGMWEKEERKKHFWTTFLFHELGHACCMMHPQDADRVFNDSEIMRKAIEWPVLTFASLCGGMLNVSNMGYSPTERPGHAPWPP